MTNPEPLLQIRNLKVRFGKTNVLRGIDLDMHKGKTVAVIGESGAGKTTLGLSLAGLSSGALSGEILFRGQNILTLDEAEMRNVRWNHISLVFQNVGDVLNPVLPVLEQVAEPIIEHGMQKKKQAVRMAVDLLLKTGLSSKKHYSYPHQLSGGEKQRVMIAMAMSNNPDLVILDEPTASLDAATRSEIMELLRELGRERAMLLVTHDISLAAALSHSTIVMYAGQVLEAGPTGHILKNPRHPYTRGLIRCYPNMNTTKDLMGIKGRAQARERGCSFLGRCTQHIEACTNAEPQLHRHDARLLACHRGGIIPILEVKGVKKYFGNTKAVDGVHLTLYEGETVALVGESGSGKSTLAGVIMGLIPRTTGDIILEGDIISRRNKNFYSQVQVIFQNPRDSVNHRSSVLNAVKEPLDIQGVGSEAQRLDKVKKCLEEVELPWDEEFLAKYPHQLSGGEMQRLATARAMVLEPKVLIADEPTSALDPSIQAKIMKLLLNLQEKKGLSILFITHDLALARKVSDRMAIMQRGKIVEEGPTSEVVSSPSHQYTKTLIKAAPVIKFMAATENEWEIEIEKKFFGT